MTPHYQSPEISGHEDAVKGVLKNFLVESSANPHFIPERAVHEATVYVMQHLPSGLSRVDGKVIEPLLRSTIEDMLHAPAEQSAPSNPEQSAPAPEPAQQNVFVRTVKNLWKKVWN